MSNRLSGKNRSKKDLAGKIEQSKIINENLEGALNCLVATVYRQFPIMTRDNVKDGEDYLPLFEIHGAGDVGIRGMGYVLVKEKLTIRDKYRNIKNGYSAKGLVREKGHGIFGIRGLLARFRRPKTKDKRNEEVGQPESGEKRYTPAPTS